MLVRQAALALEAFDIKALSVDGGDVGGGDGRGVRLGNRGERDERGCVSPSWRVQASTSRPWHVDISHLVVESFGRATMLSATRSNGDFDEVCKAIPGRPPDRLSHGTFAVSESEGGQGLDAEDGADGGHRGGARDGDYSRR